jgi:hypothetical protein
VLLAAGVGAVVGLSLDPQPAFAGSLFTLFILGAILSSWVGVGLSMARPTR